MNDFTKEELIILKNGIEYLPNSLNLSKQYLESCQRVTEKLQFMIENYCEHDAVIAIDWPGNRCMKCHKMWE